MLKAGSQLKSAGGDGFRAALLRLTHVAMAKLPWPGCETPPFSDYFVCAIKRRIVTGMSKKSNTKS
ncbi:hypothetical protein [Chelativorans alearense]|uniref:hypothetical protein n=1 Tax=Chelativorans alearense TaxID=2681495 RepID=UPI001969AB03|nr:hypothetical protein [Chelativorans alearense]